MQVIHDNNITICTASLYALHYISGFFLIMSPAEGLHFSALVCLVIVVALLSRPFRAIFFLLFRIFNIKSDQFHHFYVQHIVWQPR